MNAFQKLKSALSAKLTIADASTAIREAKAVLNDPTNSMEEGPASTAAKIWSEAKAGTLPKFMSSTEAKNVIALAAREANGGAPSAPPAVVPSPAAQAITKPAPAPAAATAPAPAAAKSLAGSPAPSFKAPTPKPGPHASLPIHEVVSMLSAARPESTRTAAKAEISNRQGFFTIENTAFVQLWKYHGMSNDERNAFRDAGGKISSRNPSAAEKAGTVADFLSGVGADDEPTVKFSGNEQEYTFPVASAKRRTIEEFLELSRADIKAIGAECALPRGAALRREIFDACNDMKGKTILDEKQRNLRAAFQSSYSAAFNWIHSLGPHALDKGEVPTLTGKMTAQELLSLPDVAAAGLDESSYKPGGRYTRREIKSAYQAASSGERAALLARFKLSLKRDPYEYI